MANIRIGEAIQVGKKIPSLDARYGPWDSKQACIDTLGPEDWDVISEGLTVGIKENGGVEEYWFKDLPENTPQIEINLVDYLVKKNADPDLRWL